MKKTKKRPYNRKAPVIDPNLLVIEKDWDPPKRNAIGYSDLFEKFDALYQGNSIPVTPQSKYWSSVRGAIKAWNKKHADKKGISFHEIKNTDGVVVMRRAYRYI